MSIPNVSPHTPHWFMLLDQGTQKQISGPLLRENQQLFSSKVNGKTNLAHALAYSRWEAEGKNGAEPCRNEDIDQIIKLLDEAAFPRVPDDNPEKKSFYNRQAVEAWKQKINILTACARDFKILSSVAKGGTVCAVGMGLLYRSHKILMIANLCAACALAILSKFGAGLALSFEKLTEPLNELSIENLGNFEQNLSDACQEAEKVNVLVRFYFKHLRKGLEGTQKHQIFLDEYLFSLSQARAVLNQFKSAIIAKFIPQLNGCKTKLENKKTDINKIEMFFQRLYKICSVGAAVSGGFTILNGALTYHAFMQRAYLMVSAGLINTIGLCMMTHELVKVSIGSKKVSSGKDIVPEIKDLLSQSKLIKAMSNGYEVSTECDIEQVIVIPIEAIIKLAQGYQPSVKG